MPRTDPLKSLWGSLLGQRPKSRLDLLWRRFASQTWAKRKVEGVRSEKLTRVIVEVERSKGRKTPDLLLEAKEIKESLNGVAQANKQNHLK